MPGRSKPMEITLILLRHYGTCIRPPNALRDQNDTPRIKFTNPIKCMRNTTTRVNKLWPVARRQVYSNVCGTEFRRTRSDSSADTISICHPNKTLLLLRTRLIEWGSRLTVLGNYTTRHYCEDYDRTTL